MKASRDSFGEELAALGEKNSAIVCLDADLSKSTKSEKFAKKFPERFFQMGIAEANMLGTAAGLSLSGKIPFACSFGCFITGRYDQIRMSVCYNRANVKIVGTHSGIAIGEDGHSQMGLDDVAILRSLPNMSIFQPADDTETRAVLRFMAADHGPSYLRLTRQKLPSIFEPDSYRFQPGKWHTLLEGKSVALIGTGALVHSLLEANRRLGESFTVVNACSLKPVDERLILHLAENYDLIVTAEDHYSVGGLGSAVAEIMSLAASKAALHRIGVESFGESGSPEDMYKHYKLDADGIVIRLKRLLEI
jgi:transketolase